MRMREYKCSSVYESKWISNFQGKYQSSADIDAMQTVQKFPT